MEIAVYGKGGIGKSTVSANLSAALALAGSRVLQIGCDPKHDSTRLLMHGESIPTVLDYLKTTTREQEDVGEVLKTGFLGTGCIEAGGPKPGVGCAGRGIISAFEFLDRHHVKEQYTTVIYDVLGDVVCGGFAVPVRREYADAVFLVTSGEYMALYAANNILRGIRNFDGDGFKRVAGIIFNERKLPDEGGRVSRFAGAVGLPVCACVPRSAGFSDAEERNLTLMEMEGYEAEKAVFGSLASHILSNPELYAAHPLEDEELEAVVLKTGRMTVKRVEETQKSAGNIKSGRNDTAGGVNAPSVAGTVSLENDEAQAAGEMPGKRLPLYGCAFNGVATQAVHLTDALVIAHSPRACAFYTWQNISSTGRKNLFNRGILMPSSISPNFECTDMGHSEVVFGGMDKLREYVSEGISRGYSAVVVVSSCTSGIIGDDIKDIEELSTPGCPVIAIAADGDIAGDYMEGIRLCMETLAGRLIDPEVKPEGRKVNLINEGSCLNNGELNHRIMESMLGEMGISINCRFLGDATVDEMRHFLAAPLNILADDGEDGRKLAGWLSDRYGCSFLEGGFPVGFASTESFLRKVGAFFDCGGAAEALIGRNLQEYRARVGKLRPLLSGKRILMTTINIDLDWIIEAAHDVGMEFVWIGVLNYLRREICVTKHPDYCAEISEYVDWQLIHEKIEEQKPDIVLTNYTSAVKEGAYFTDAVPMTPVVGFHSALHLFERWAKLMAGQGKGRKGGWRHDKTLFEKYYG